MGNSRRSTADGMAYFLRKRRLVAIRLQDEQELWRSERLEALEEVAETSSPFGTGVKIACAERFLTYAYWQVDDQGNSLHAGALDPASGMTLWQWHSPEPTPTLYRGFSLVTIRDWVCLSQHDKIYAFQGSDGHLLWTIPVGFNLVRMLAASVPLEEG